MTTPSDLRLEFDPVTLSPVRHIVGAVDQRYVTGQTAIDEVRRHLALIDDAPRASHVFSLSYWSTIHDDPQVRDYVRDALTERKMWHEGQGWYFQWMADPWAWETQYALSHPVEYTVVAAICPAAYRREGITISQLGGDTSRVRSGATGTLHELPELIQPRGFGAWDNLLSAMHRWLGGGSDYHGEPAEQVLARRRMVHTTVDVAAWLAGRSEPGAPTTLTHPVYSVVAGGGQCCDQTYGAPAQAAAMLWTALKLWWSRGSLYDGPDSAERNRTLWKLRSDLWWMSKHLHSVVAHPDAQHTWGYIAPVLNDTDDDGGDTAWRIDELVDPFRLPFCNRICTAAGGAVTKLYPSNLTSTGEYCQITELRLEKLQTRGI